MVEVFDVHARLLELPEECTQVEERARQLHEETLHEHEVTRCHPARVHVAYRQDQVEREAHIENGLLPNVECAQALLDNHGLARHPVQDLAVPALLEPFVVELLHGLVIRDRLVLVKLLLLVDLLLLADLFDAPLAEAVGVPGVSNERHDHVDEVAGAALELQGAA